MGTMFLPSAQDLSGPYLAGIKRSGYKAIPIKPKKGPEPYRPGTLILKSLRVKLLMAYLFFTTNISKNPMDLAANLPAWGYCALT
jgi:hypothetical protein